MQELLVLGSIRGSASQQAVEAMLLRDGVVVETGSRDDALAQAYTHPEVVDFGDRVVLPGFVDAHCHPLMFGQMKSWVECGWIAQPTITSVVNALAERAKQTAGPVRGQGFHHGNVSEQRMLNRHDLDQVATDREVMVFHSSGHGAIINSWTLTKLGITADTPDPTGGHFGRETDGTPDGTVWDAAADWLTGELGVKIGRNGPNFHISDDLDDLDGHLLRAQHLMHRHGITTVVDAQVTSREFGAYTRLRQQGRLTLRAEMLIISSLLAELEGLGINGRFGDEQLAIAGVKLYADGALTAGTARFNQPYCCDPTDFGYLYHPNGELASMIARVDELGLPAATHAQGDAAIQLVLDAHEEIRHFQRAHRHRIEHYGAPTPQQIVQTKQLHLTPIPQPQYLTNYGDELLEALGERAHRLFPLGEMRDADVPVVISSDAPVCEPDPFAAIQSAVTRKTKSGVQLGPTSQQLTVAEALAAHTIAAAASIGRDHAVGSLEPGKHGDFIVIDQDPFDVEADELSQIHVVETWVAGQHVHSEK